MKFLKQQNVFGWLALASAVLSLVAMIFYIVTGATGFLAGNVVNPAPIILTILGIAALVAAALLSEKLDRRIIGGILFAAVILLAISLCVFVTERVQLFADVYFIPVNYPAAEGSALTVSIVGMVFYIVSLVGTVVAGFAEKLNKEEA